MTERKKLKYRYFFLSFAVSFFILSLLFYLLMNAVHPKLSPSLMAEPLTETVTYLPTVNDALTVLFVGIFPGGTEADTFILARFDPLRGKVPVVAFPPQTAVQNGDKVSTLAECFRYGGAAFTRTKLADTLGIKIHRYARMDVSTFIVAANTVGTVEYHLSLPVTLGQSGALPVTLSQGIQLLDGQKAAEIIHYGGYSGGELVRCQNTAELTAAIVNQRIDVAMSTMVDKVFEKIINLIDTDISYPDYDNRKEAARFLAQLGQDPAIAIPVAGRYNADNTVYTLADTFIALLTQTYT